MSSIREVITECERVIVEAIKEFSLTVKPEDIIVTVQSRGRKKNVLGWFAWDRWKAGSPTDEKKDGFLHEINLVAEALSVHNMGETLLHEMAHAENHKLGIKDVSGNQCHNKKFKEMAERLGLTVAPRDKARGYAFTDLGPVATAFLEKIAFKRECFQLFRLLPEKLPVGSRLIKCECPSCGYIVRTTRKWIDTGVPTCACGKVMEADE